MAETRLSPIIGASPKKRELVEIIEEDKIGELHNYSTRNLFAYNFEGKNIFYLAVEKGAVAILDYLLRLNFNKIGKSKAEYLAGKDANGISVAEAIISNNKLLEEAARKDHVSIVKQYPMEKLLKYRPATGGNLFHFLALNNNSYESLEYIVEKEEFGISSPLRDQEDILNRTPLFCAIEARNIYFIQEFAKNAKLCNIVNSIGLRPMSLAIKTKSLKVVQELRKGGATIDALDLAQAVLADSSELVDYILDCMIESQEHLLQKDFINTLRWAALGNYYGACQKLFSFNMHRNFPDMESRLDILFVLIKLGLLDEVKYFFYQRLISGLLTKINGILFKDRSIFDVIIENGNVETLAWLFTSRYAAVLKIDHIKEKIVNGVYSNDDMKLFLIRIYSEMNTNVVHKIVDEFFIYKNKNVFIKDITFSTGAGEYIDARDEKYNTALMRIAATEYSDLLSFLLKRKASVDNENANGKSVLHIAVAASQKENVKLLLEHDASNLLHMDIFGNTPLHEAAKGDNPEIIDLLAAYDIKDIKALHIENIDGEIPLHIAAYYGSYNVVKKLLELAPDSVLFKNNEGMLPLHKAVWRFTEDFATFMLLVNYNSEALNIPDKHGDTPFHYFMRIWLANSMQWQDVCLDDQRFIEQLDNFRFLLNKGANSDFKNAYNETPESALRDFIRNKKLRFLRGKLENQRDKYVNEKDREKAYEKRRELNDKMQKFLLPYKAILLEFRINKFNKLIAEFEKIGGIPNYIKYNIELHLFIYYSAEIDYKKLAEELVSAVQDKINSAEIHEAVCEIVNSRLSENSAVNERIARWYARFEGKVPDMLSRLLIDEAPKELSASSYR